MTAGVVATTGTACRPAAVLIGTARMVTGVITAARSALPRIGATGVRAAGMAATLATRPALVGPGRVRAAVTAAGRGATAVVPAAATGTRPRGLAPAGRSRRRRATAAAEPARPLRPGRAAPAGQGETLPRLAVGLRLVAGPATRPGFRGGPAAEGPAHAGMGAGATGRAGVPPGATGPEAAAPRRILVRQPGVVSRPAGVARPARIAPWGGGIGPWPRGRAVVLAWPARVCGGTTRGLIRPGAVAVPPRRV
jgi:hypothetical protein